MRLALIAYLVLIMGLIHPVNMSFSASPEDLEGSTNDDDYGSQDDIEDHSDSKDAKTSAENSGDDTKSSLSGSSVLTFDQTPWPLEDSEARFTFVASSKSFVENEEIFAGIIAGGVTGVALAVAVSVIVIYKWQKEDNDGYILGRQRDSDENYHKPNRE